MACGRVSKWGIVSLIVSPGQKAGTGARFRLARQHPITWSRTSLQRCVIVTAAQRQRRIGAQIVRADYAVTGSQPLA